MRTVVKTYKFKLYKKQKEQAPRRWYQYCRFRLELLHCDASQILPSVWKMSLCQ